MLDKCGIVKIANYWADRGGVRWLLLLPISQPAEETASPSACQRIPESNVKHERRELVMLVVVVMVTAPLLSALRLTAVCRLGANLSHSFNRNQIEFTFIICTLYDGRPMA